MRSPKNSHRQYQPRRRGFDDDNFYGNTPTPVPLPSFASASSAPEVSATVKWFNAEKGFGFAALADGSGDVFLHVNTLQAAGRQTVAPGATMRVRVAAGQKGRQVEQVVSVDDSTAEQPEQRRPQFGASRPQAGPRRQVDLSSAVEMVGTVKWYDPAKGFGFITPQEGGRDVFIHADRSGACRPGAVAGAAVSADGCCAGCEGPRSRHDQPERVAAARFLHERGR